MENKIKEIIEKLEHELNLIEHDMEIEKLDAIRSICKLIGYIPFREEIEFDDYVHESSINEIYPLLWNLTDADKKIIEDKSYCITIIDSLYSLNVFETLNEALEWLKNI